MKRVIKKKMNKCTNKTLQKERNEVEVIKISIRSSVSVCEVLTCFVSIGVKRSVLPLRKSKRKEEKPFKYCTAFDYRQEAVIQHHEV